MAGVERSLLAVLYQNVTQTVAISQHNVTVPLVTAGV